MSFQNFNLSEKMLKAITDMGYEKPTEIQELAIPLLLTHQGDFVGQAQTGTGKTAAFVIPLIETIDFKIKDVQVLILTPTRELAHQVAIEIEKFGKNYPLKVVQVYGGTSYERQINGIKKDRPQIIVGTPGRTIDLIDRGVLKLGATKQLVIDEADEMLNMGFIEDVQTIIDTLNETRRVWMFSATMPKPILDLIERKFNAPEIIRVKNKTLSNENISQYFCLLKRRNFAEGLQRLMDLDDVYGIVFCETRKEAQELFEELNEKGISVAVLHGDMNQSQRDMSMMRFKTKKVNLMVCTDVAARGIDVSNITHVINFGFPRNHESYIHRIGRTGRAGTKGMAITFLGPEDSYQIKKMEVLTRSKVGPFKLPSTMDTKKIKISKELEKMETLRNAIKEKGENFKIDQSFEIFKDYFAGLSSEDSLKLLFSWKFNKELRQIDDRGEITLSFDSDRGERSRDFGRSRFNQWGGQGGGRDNRRRSGGGGGGGSRQAGSSSRNKVGSKTSTFRDRKSY